MSRSESHHEGRPTEVSTAKAARIEGAGAVVMRNTLDVLGGSSRDCDDLSVWPGAGDSLGCVLDWNRPTAFLRPSTRIAGRGGGHRCGCDSSSLYRVWSETFFLGSSALKESAAGPDATRDQAEQEQDWDGEEPQPLLAERDAVLTRIPRSVAWPRIRWSSKLVLWIRGRACRRV